MRAIGEKALVAAGYIKKGGDLYVGSIRRYQNCSGGEGSKAAVIAAYSCAHERHQRAPNR